VHCAVPADGQAFGTRDDLVVTRWQRDERTLWRAAPGARVVMLPPGAPSAACLSETAAAVWYELASPSSIGHLSRRLGERYGADPSQVHDDVQRLVDELARLGAIRSAP
jgi:hypothetical protein